MTRFPCQAGARERSVSRFALVLLLVMTIPGCSLGVMFNKMIFGDPKIKSQFRVATDVDLTKGEKSLLIICKAPHGTQTKYPSIEIDIVERMSRHLKVRKVRIINSDEVTTWFDDHGDWGNYPELASRFRADFIMQIQIDSFRCDVPDSPNLLQGKTDGKVTIYRAVDDIDVESQLPVAFERTFDVTYPAYPVPRESQSEINFVEGFLDRTSISLSQMLYDYRVSETVH
ncbi:MAG: hypothetical protein ACK58L_04070 [Planctomycetota bacterium]